jgi:CHASE2 domain-containing sensor protein
VSFDPQLWIAMAAAALFYHYARSQKATVHLYLFLSVSVSAAYLLWAQTGWLGLIIAQLALFVFLVLIGRKRDERK